MTSPGHAIHNAPRSGEHTGPKGLTGDGFESIRSKGRHYGPCGLNGCPLLEATDGGNAPLISITNAQGVVAKPALVPTAAKLTAAAAWDALPLMVATSRQPEQGRPADGDPKPCDKRSPVSTRCGECRFCLNMAIKAAHRNEWDKAADLGTAVHAAAHAHVLGEPRHHDPEIDPFVDQHVAFLQAWRIDLDRHIEAAETTVFDAKNRYAGTGDLWLHLPLAWDAAKGCAVFTSWTRRKLWLIDGKSSATKPANVIYADQPLQLAALRYAPTTMVDETVIKTPRFEGAAILNWRTDAHALIPQPSGREVHKAFLAAVTLQRHFHSLDTRAWTPLDPPVVAEPDAA